MPADVRRHRVVPARARRELERLARELLDHVPRRVAAAAGQVGDADLAIRRVDVRSLHEPVRESRLVAKRSRTFIGRWTGVVFQFGWLPPTKTPWSFHDGMNLCTGSSSWKRPCSHSIINPTLTRGFVIE